MTRELLIKGGYVVTVDPELGDLPDGDVLVREDIIAAVGPALTASSPGTEVIDARGRGPHVRGGSRGESESGRESAVLGLGRDHAQTGTASLGWVWSIPRQLSCRNAGITSAAKRCMLCRVASPLLIST